MAKHADPLRVRRLVAGVVAWVGFGAIWLVLLQRNPRAWLPQLAVPAALVVVVAVLTGAWVRHNLRIYQRKGPRRGVPSADAPWTADSLGRRLDFDPTATTAPVVHLTLRDGVKRYEVAS